MGQLAEPRKRQRYTLMPRGKPLYEDKTSFGTKMLEKMGWKEGKGLGANEDGDQNFLRVRYKNDAEGFGYTQRDNQWTAHQQSFDGLLQTLKGSDNDTMTDKMSIESDGNTLKWTISGESLEQKSKKSRARVHYKKYTRGKDLSQYSEKDLANIFGKKTLNELSEIETNNIKNEQSEIVEEKVEDLFRSSTLSVNDYFKMKMQALKQKQQGKNEVINSVDLEEPNGKDKSKKSKKRKSTSSEELVLVAGTMETEVENDAQKMSPKKKKKKEKLLLDNEYILNQVDQDNEKEQHSKKKKKKSNKVEDKLLNEEESIPLNGNIEEENLENSHSIENQKNGVEIELSEKRKKKKKKENKDSLKEEEKAVSENLVKSDQINEEVAQLKKKKKQKKEKEIKLDQVNEKLEDTCNQKEIELAPLKQKKQKKEKVDKEITLEQINKEEETSNQEVIESTKLKKKERKLLSLTENVRNEETIVKIDNITCTSGRVSSEENTSSKKSKKKETKVGAPAEGDNVTEVEKNCQTNIKVAQNMSIMKTASTYSEMDNLTMDDIENKLKARQVYKISKFVAEKFKFTDFAAFKGANLVDIKGYDMDSVTQLEVVEQKDDEKRILELWTPILDKGNMQQVDKFSDYQQQLLEARKNKEKMPRFKTHQYRRKNAFKVVSI